MATRKLQTLSKISAPAFSRSGGIQPAWPSAGKNGLVALCDCLRRVTGTAAQTVRLPVRLSIERSHNSYLPCESSHATRVGGGDRTAGISSICFRAWSRVAIHGLTSPHPGRLHGRARSLFEEGRKLGRHRYWRVAFTVVDPYCSVKGRKALGKSDRPADRLVGFQDVPVRGLRHGHFVSTKVKFMDGSVAVVNFDDIAEGVSANQELFRCRVPNLDPKFRAIELTHCGRPRRSMCVDRIPLTTYFRSDASSILVTAARQEQRSEKKDSAHPAELMAFVIQ